MPLSPTALTIKIALEDVPGTWLVRDDPDSYSVLVNDGAALWVNKMSGGWMSCDPTYGGKNLPPEVMGAITKVLGFEHSPGRGFRHIEWRNKNMPPPNPIELG